MHTTCSPQQTARPGCAWSPPACCPRRRTCVGACCSAAGRSWAAAASWLKPQRSCSCETGMPGLLPGVPQLCGRVLLCHRPPSGGNSILTNATKGSQLQECPCSAATSRYLQEAQFTCEARLSSSKRWMRSVTLADVCNCGSTKANGVSRTAKLIYRACAWFIC